MAKDLYIPVALRGNRLEAKASLGQTVIVTEGPETYTGPMTVTPTTAEQTLLTKDKLLTDNVTINAAGEWGKGTLVYEGTATGTDNVFSVVTLPNGLPFSFDRLTVEITYPNRGINSGWRQYWRSDLPMTGNQTYMLNTGVCFISNNDAVLKSTSVLTIIDDYIEHLSYGYNVLNIAQTASRLMYQKCDEYNKITAYGWWAFIPPIGTHIKITGYNRTNVVSST